MRDQTMILDIAQIALPELGQKIQRKFSDAKASIWLCGELALNCDASASWASRQLRLNRTVPDPHGFEECKRRRTLPF
jgi:hypothetical protein